MRSLSCLVWFLVVVVGDRVPAADLLRIGVVGDSLSNEYSTGKWENLSWVELLAMERDDQVTFGRQGEWGFPRKTGYEFSWAFGGASSSDLLQQGQHTGVADQGVDLVLVAVGTNDIGSSYRDILSGKADPKSIVDTLIGNLTTILDELEKTATNRKGVKIVLCNVLDYGDLPAVQLLASPNHRATVRAVVVETNRQIAKLAEDRTIPLVDIYSFIRLKPRDFVVCGMTLEDVAVDTPTAVLCPDGAHPGTAMMGLIANCIVEAANRAYQLELRPLSDQETLKAAKVPVPEDREEPTFYPVRHFCCFCRLQARQLREIGKMRMQIGPEFGHEHIGYVSTVKRSASVTRVALT